MHIPDGYLSPSTCAVMYAATLPFWYRASQSLRRAMNARVVPLLALFAAFCFVVMMFNFPLPGGTTGHAVGSTLAAIVLGPWPAVIAVSVALAIQALLFGDGGILALGANSFNMAVAMPLFGYLVYRLIGGHSPVTSARRPIGAAIAGYLALNLAALLTALEFGVQPYFFKAADGTPLYGPYGLNVAIPAMVGGHLLVAGFAEALITGLVVAYLQRTNQALLAIPETKGETTAQTPGLAPWVILAVLVILTPLGLLAPGTAWGEWGAEELGARGLGFIPQGLERLGSIWPAPIRDYTVPAIGANLGYVLSAGLGILLVVLLIWLLSLALRLRKVAN